MQKGLSVTEVTNATVKLLSPLHTGSDEVSGIDKTIRQDEFLIGGKVIQAPILASNSIRGVIRRLLAKDFLDLLDLDIESLNPEFYYLLFSGGSLSKGGGDIDIGSRRELYKNIPLVALMGGSNGNAILQGVLIVEDMLPIVKELEEITNIKTNVSVFDILGDRFGTRKDDYPLKDEVVTDTHQMLYRFENIIAGAEMKLSMYLLSVASKMDKSICNRAINLLVERGRLGGKVSNGFGKIKYNIEKKDDSLYLDYIKDDRDKILEYLKENGFLNV